MRKTYHHPKTGEAISYHWWRQLRNKAEGMCLAHSHRPAVHGLQHCEACLAKRGGERYDKLRWESVDWSQTNIAIARALGVTGQSVAYQRRKRGHELKGGKASA